MGRSSCDVAIVGSGFAGSILARVLAKRGLEVVLVERGRHPRFALGESSTPLAALALERLAARWELPDLHALAAYGRWRRRLPELRRGLKRGFTFYHHASGEPFQGSARNERRLLFAASPNAEVADAHWLREDVDAHLAREAVRAGARLWERSELEAAEPLPRGLRLVGRRLANGERFELDARTVVDGSGRGGFLSCRVGLGAAGEAPRPAVATDLVFAHFEGVEPFEAAAAAAGARLPAGPYPDSAAAVHHLLEEGWIYALAFDHGVASCGLVLDRASALPGESATATWRRVVGRYPTLARSFARARPTRPLQRVERLAYRRPRAAGKGWLLLPHTFAFADPMFSTGIAWSLLAVERLAEVLCGEADAEDYARRLAREADHVEGLVRLAARTRGDFRAFTAATFLYFAAASWCESRQRLLADLQRPAWEGFLGADDEPLAVLPGEALERLEAADAAAFEAWLLRRLAPRDVAGLGDPARRNLYPLDLDLLVERADLLGLSRHEVRAALPRLRGFGSS